MSASAKRRRDLRRRRYDAATRPQFRGLRRTYPLTPEGVERALTALGRTSGAVAGRMAALGIRGQLDNDCDCPIGRYLPAVVPGLERVSVGSTEAFVSGWEHDDLGFTVHFGPMHISLPEAVTDFIEAFDAERYPELIEEVKPHVG
ncbi:hypothetical protein ACQP1P_38825 [Dactylosporangium sp. CA-052675]|uniref:hypothetical protein n=1 Tax=Dactylosporangium sp. CA-052675 TaxID=3239927 RepID=UPI003D936141